MSHITIPLLLWLLSSSVLAQVQDDVVAKSRSEKAQQYFGDEMLVDQHGQSYRFFSDLLSRHVVLINVIFTHCQDACPMQTQRLRMVRNQLGDRFGTKFLFLSLSVDPERDDPQAMKAFAEKQQANVPGWYFLTAEKTVLQQILNRLGQWTDDPSNHSTLIIAGNAQNAHWVKLRPDSPLERIVADLLRLAEH